MEGKGGGEGKGDGNRKGGEGKGARGGRPPLSQISGSAPGSHRLFFLRDVQDSFSFFTEFRTTQAHDRFYIYTTLR